MIERSLRWEPSQFSAPNVKAQKKKCALQSDEQDQLQIEAFGIARIRGYSGRFH